ncbi:hypothetical protein JHD50_05625 [Sulfurimonas sp. MAG313]|nr:hypothetical protein [Sulfurimonas sp. MAG313]MDF1880788.1 hypothetical protein [Sulfurimonas sp. MAG313]
MKKILILLLILLNINVFATSFTMKELRFEQRKVVLSAFKKVHSVRKFQHKVSQRQKHHKLKKVSKKSLFQYNMRQDLEDGLDMDIEKDFDDRSEMSEDSDQEFLNKIEREKNRTLTDLRNLNLINVEVEDLEDLRHFAEPDHPDTEVEIEIEVGIDIDIDVGMEDDVGTVLEDTPLVDNENKPDIPLGARKYSPWKRK